MSDQLTDQSRSNESGITRRTALRGAAWSVSAVTIVVAAPAHAATSGRAGTATGTIRRNGQKGITPNVTFTNTGALPYTLVVVIAFKNGSVTQTSAGAVAAGGTLSFPTAFEVQSNDDDQTVTMTYYHNAIDPSFKLGTLTFADVDKSSSRTGTWAV